MMAAAWSLLGIPLRHRGWPRWVDAAFEVLNVPIGPSVFTAVLLVILSGAVRRRQRAAWAVILAFESVVAALAAAAFVALANDWSTVRVDDGVDHRAVVLAGANALIGLTIAVVMWRARAAFPARLAEGSWRASITVLVAGLVTSSLVTFGLVEASPPRGPHGVRRYEHGAPQRMWHSVRAALGGIPGSHYSVLSGRYNPHWIMTLAGVLSAIALLASAAIFLRSARVKQSMTAEDELTLRGLLLTHGERDSLGYFATRRDKSVVFSPDHKAAVTYRIVASVSLASADPIGATDSWAAAIEAWLSEARRHGWLPAVLSASEQGAREYVRAGLRARGIGDEAIIEVGRYSLRGHAMRQVRQAVARVRRAGYTLQVRPHAAISATEMTQLSHLAEQWRDDETERGFSMALGRLGEQVDDRCVMVTAHSKDGTVAGLLSFVPWGARGLSLDLMRRRRDAENGLVEFMISGLVAACPELGIRRISLNFAMFRAVFSGAEQVGAGPITRFTDKVLGVASRFWQLESLYRSNEKYLPVWVPRFICLDPALPLTRAAIASGMAEGFLPGPRPAVRTGTSKTTPELVSIDGQVVDLTTAAVAQEQRLLSSAPSVPTLGEQQQIRRDKIALLERAGQQAYPARVPRDCSLGDVRTCHGDLPPNAATGVYLAVAGRVRALRDLGGVSFAVLAEDSHHLQVMLQAGRTPAGSHRLWRQTIDLGDHVSVTGEVVTSRRGELSILVQSWHMASKCLQPLPNTHAGLEGPTTRSRQRHLDLIMNPSSLSTLQARSNIVATIRSELSGRGFSEVETPMLHNVHGGASARPFITQMNAYDTNLYLRIAPELFLKRLCVGGLTRIFELNRNFRNEGVDATHNPEFTSVEAYQTYSDYHDMRALTQELITAAAITVHGEAIALRADASGGEPTPFDLTGTWPIVPVHEAVSRACGAPLTPQSTIEQVRDACLDQGMHVGTTASAGELIMMLYEDLVEKTTVCPTFYIDFPIESAPLARRHRTEPALAERWDLVAFGYEVGTAYSELTDPIDQRQRLTEQSLKAAAGDLEAMDLDEAFLAALEYAMPPTGGLGLGIDRLVMMLTGTTIRHTLAFPFVRPDQHT